MTKHQKNYALEARRQKKIALAILFIMVFSAGIVSAWDWDNVKRYDDTGKYGTIRIVNALGLGGTIASYTLDYNTNLCFEDCYATGTAILYADARLFTQLKFKDTKGSLKQIETNIIYIKEYYTEKEDIYDKDNKTITGTKDVQKSRLVEYNGEILTAGTYEWRIEGKKGKSETIDWIASTDFGGFELSEWAWWSAPINTYEFSDAGAGSVCNTYTGSWCRQNFTIGAVGPNVNFTLTSIGLKLIRAGTPSNYQVTLMNASYDVVAANTTINVNNIGTSSYLLYNISMPNIQIANYGKYYVEVNATGGDAGNYIGTSGITPTSYAQGVMQGSTNQGASWSIFVDYDLDFFIYGSQGIFNVVLDNPTNALSTGNTSLNFSSSYTTSELDFINNTYFVWQGNTIINQTTVLIPESNQTSLVISNFNPGNYKWNVVTCGNSPTETYCNSASVNYTFSITSFTVLGTYNKHTVYETAYEYFQANMSVPIGATLHSSLFYYNGTQYTASASLISGQSYKVSKSIDIPTILSNITKNFLWQIAYTNVTGAITYENTTVYTQNVSKINFAKCNATYTIKVINFTSKDSQSYANINTTFLSSWNYWLGTGSQKANYSFQEATAGNSSWEFCISENLTFINDATISYKGNGYAQNWYYLSSSELNNTINYINLYNLNEGNSTITTLHIQDNYENPLADRIIQVQKYDVGTDSYYLVAMGKTNFEGNDIVYLNWYDTFYKFVIIYNATIELITEPTKISASPITFTIRPDVLFHYDEFSDVSWSLTFNNDTSNFVLTFVDTAGTISEGCLQVQRYTALTQDVVCDICEASASATLYCNIGSYRNGTYTANFYAKGSWPWHVFEVLTKYFEITSRSFYERIGPSNGVIMTVILAGTVMAVGLFNPAAAIILFLIGIFVSASLGFTILNMGAFIGLVIVGAIIIWKLQT